VLRIVVMVVETVMVMMMTHDGRGGDCVDVDGESGCFGGRSDDDNGGDDGDGCDDGCST
jgi:hypothetical protein